ncbi:MAG TPA: hotdog domain-containing protein, partial [Jiangellales bacterium]|nr:hotdog domain-containing protein [Jiangellales bacterium]
MPQQGQGPAGVRTGAVGAVSHLVADEDTAAAVGSGDVPVLATPRLLALAEAATVAALAGALRPGQTSVGTRVELQHLLPSPVGTRVDVRAVVRAVDGRLVSFEVTAEHPHPDGRVVGHGRVTRVVVERDRFLARAAQDTGVQDAGA